MKNVSSLNQIAIVLVRPRVAENIGSAARIALNMGIERLILVREELPHREAMAKTATHNAAHLIDRLELYPQLEQALAEFSLILGTTARRGRQRCSEQSPRDMVAKLPPYVAANKIAVLFGPEDTGLTNDELKHCHQVCTIPTADFSSLNLAQAVAIVCYELYYGIIHAKKDMAPAPQLATSYELEAMYRYLEEALYTIRFLDTTNRSHWLNNIRRLLGRVALTKKEANIIRGICKKFMHYKKT